VLINPTELAVDQRNANTTSPALIKNGKNEFVKAIINATMFIGQTQYPSTQTL